MLKSRAPIALVILETSSGTIKHFSMRKNKSPGYCIYITSRSVHGLSLLFSAKPRPVPPNTPTIVKIVSRFVLRNFFHRELGLELLEVPYDVDILCGPKMCNMSVIKLKNRRFLRCRKSETNEYEIIKTIIKIISLHT